MCGVFGYVGEEKKDLSNFLLAGLSKLEYRGYDSAGIAVFKNGKSKIFKQVGEIKNLKALLNGRVFSGNLGIGYDFDILLKAAQYLISENVKFIIRGFGVMYNEIKNKIEKYELNNVILNNSIVDMNTLRTILNSASIFVVPMKDYFVAEMGLPTKILEYQSCGKPIICVSNGESAEYVLSTKSGLVVKPGDYPSLVKSILYLRDNPNIAKEFGKSGRKYIVNNLSIEKMGKKLTEVCDLLND